MSILSPLATPQTPLQRINQRFLKQTPFQRPCQPVQFMIKHYRDHAANERTYLAWIRTGITVMMLGFLVEKFELFFALLIPRAPAAAIAKAAREGPELTSVGLVVLGLFIIITATLRYLNTKHKIDGEKTEMFQGVKINIALTVLMMLFGVYLLLYLVNLI